MTHHSFCSPQNHILRLTLCRQTKTVFLLVEDEGITYLTAYAMDTALHGVPAPDAILPEVREAIRHTLSVLKKHSRIPSEILVCFADRHIHAGHFAALDELLNNFCHFRTASIDRLTGATYEEIVVFSRSHFSGNTTHERPRIHVVNTPVRLAV